MQDVYVRVVEGLPPGVYGAAFIDRDGEQNVYLDAGCDRKKMLEVYEHELRHIRRGDLFRSGDVDEMEKPL